MTDRTPKEAFDTEPMRAAARAGLEAIDQRSTELTPIGRGNRKRTAIARFGNRGPIVVQVCAEQSWLRTEAALLEAVRRRTFVPVPPVLTAGTHEGIAYMLTAYVAGDDLHRRFTAVDHETRRGLARWFGKALARLHEAFAFESCGRLVLSEGRFGTRNREWPSWFRAYARSAIDRLPSAFDPLRDDLSALTGHAPTVDPPVRLFPWDFRPGNALLAGESVTAVLDWEAPLAAPPAVSVAKTEYLVADWYVDDPEPLRRAFENGYAAVRPYPSVRPAHRIAAIAESAVDSAGEVTNPGYPPVDTGAAVAFHRAALEDVLDSV